jgi:hypothetical protein
VEAGFGSDIGGDVPDWDNTESRESDEDAAWRDLVARFEEPTTAAGPMPWPDRENVSGPRSQAARGPDGVAGTSEVHGTDGAQGTETALGGFGTGEAQGAVEASGAERPPAVEETGGAYGDIGAREARGAGDAQGTHGDWGVPGADEAEAARRADGSAGVHGTEGVRGTEEVQGTDGAAGVRGTEEVRGTDGARGVGGIRGFDDEGVRGAFDADGRPGTSEPDVIQPARRDRRTAAHGTPARRIRARKAPPRPGPQDEEGHFIPPAPPPLPSLDPIAKGAWVALFGGPGYLVVATAAGWSVSGIAAFCAVAAFVTGFAILVLRMNEPGPGGPDDGDDGAVV